MPTTQTDQNEINQRFAATIGRSLLQIIGAVCVIYGLITQDKANILITQLAPIVGGLIISGVTAYFQYRRAKMNVLLPKAALKADPDTPIEDVKADVKSKL